MSTATDNASFVSMGTSEASLIDEQQQHEASDKLLSMHSMLCGKKAPSGHLEIGLMCAGP